MKNLIPTIITFTLLLATSFNALNAQLEVSVLETDKEMTFAPEEVEEYLYASPNPFQTQTFICFGSNEVGQYQLEIINKMGQRVIYKSGDVLVGKNKVQVQRSGLQAGRYYYRLKIGFKQFKTGKIYIAD